VLTTWAGDAGLFGRRIEALCATGELTEQVAFLKGFAIYPAPTQLLGRAREAVRSSIQPVFERSHAATRTRPITSRRRHIIKWLSTDFLGDFNLQNL